jgi:putative lipoic acid-binding regulatory protein
MEEFDKQFEKLREQLELQEWPSVYMFKFIVPAQNISEIKPLFETGEMSTRSSKNGKYISVTIKMVMFSVDHVMDRYRSVSHITGIISL